MAAARNQTASPSLQPTSSLSLKDQLYSQQITQLYAVAPLGIIASLLSGFMLVAVLWTTIPHQGLINWFLCLVVINMIWSYLVYQYRRMSPAVAHTSYWGTCFIVGNMASGMIWGAGGVFLYPIDSMMHEIILILALGGLVAGATAMHAASLKAFFAFSVPTFAPLIFRSFQQGDELHIVMGVFFLLYMAIMGLTAQRNHHMILGAITLRFENTQLLDQVSMAKDRLESMVEARTNELKTSETRYRLLAENITDVIWVMALDGSHFTYISPSIISFRGYTPEEAMALSLEETLTSNSAKKFRATLAMELAIEQSEHADPFRSRVLELEYLCKDGSTIWAEVKGSILHDESGRCTGMVGVTRDITERQELEEEHQRLETQIRSSQKMEAVGILAGGIAHDFNNLLTSVLGNIALSADPNNSSLSKAEYLARAKHAALRAKDLTHHLLTFAKGGEPIKQLVDLEVIIRESVGFSLSGSKVACQNVFPRDLWSANVDPGQMSQVVHNLIINAVNAMPNGGYITICAENLQLDTQSLDKNIPLPSGSYVKVSLRDEGCGISDQDLSKIFDPYFTTKSDGHGLGLASVYSIMKKHGGLITAESQLGVGTVFTLFIPAAPGAQVPLAAPLLQMRKGRGKILVMDDEESIQTLVGEILTNSGYRCEMAKDGYEAISKYEAAMKSEQPFSAVILDLTVAGSMGGKETLRQLQKIDPIVRAIVSSGYSNDPVMANYQSHGFHGIVLKPYSVEKLSNVVYQVVMEPSLL